MKRVLSLMVTFLTFCVPVWASSISTVSTVGEARVVLKGNDRAGAFKKAVREALKDAVEKEAALLVDNPQDVENLEGEIEAKLKDFVVKYKILEARFIQSESEEEGASPDGGYGTWYVRVKAFVDSDLLERTLAVGIPMEGG